MFERDPFYWFRKQLGRCPNACFSGGHAVVASALLSTLIVLSFHIVSADRDEVTEGQAIFGTVRQNVFLPFSVQDGLAFLIIALGVFIMLFCVALWIGRPTTHRKCVEWTWRRSLFGFFLLIIAWLPYILSWFPGGVFADTSVVISQATGASQLTNKHTVLYVMLWRICITMSRACGHDLFFATALMQVLQAILMATAAIFAINWLATRHAGHWVCVGTFAFFALFPLVPLYVISLWKDTLFSIALFCFTIAFVDAIMASLNYDKHEVGRGLAHLSEKSFEGRIDGSVSPVILVFSAIATAFLRNNGIYVVALALLALIMITRHQIRRVLRRFILPLSIVVALSVAIQGPLFGALGFNSTNSVESVGIPLQQVARTFALDGEMSQDARAYFDQLLPEEMWKAAYRPFIADTIKWNKEFNTGALSDSLPRFLYYYLETGLKNPLLYLEGFLLANSGFWNPAIGCAENVGYVSLSMWGIDMSQFDLIQQWTGFSLRSVLAPTVYISSAVFVWILLFIFLVLLVSKKTLLATALMPPLALWVTLMIATPIAYSLRYAFALVLLAPIEIGLLQVARNSRDSLDKADDNSCLGKEPIRASL